MSPTTPPPTEPGASPADDTLRRVAAGDGAALERFYEAHVDALYAHVFYRVGRDPALAEDVVQETFLEALSALDAYDPARGSVATWLALLSRNVVRRHLKAHRRSDELVEMWARIDAALAAIFDALDAAPLSDEVIARDETRELVNMTFAELPERYRQLLERKYVAGESMDDIASSLGVSPDAAKSLLARARRAFRATFQTLSRTLSGSALAAEEVTR